MADKRLPRCPAGITGAGRALFRAVVRDADEQNVDLDSLEIVFLTDAARLEMRIEEMEATLAASPTGMMVSGYQGQPVAHPLIGEIRQTRALRALTLARIKVSPPEEKTSGVVLPMGGVNQQRAAANRRWQKQRSGA
jgi:hypothetical protein